MVAETEHWQPPEAGRNKEGPPPTRAFRGSATCPHGTLPGTGASVRWSSQHSQSHALENVEGEP